MLTLPEAIISILAPFAMLFQSRTWTNAQVLLVGAVLSPGKRTVTSALRVMGLSGDGNLPGTIMSLTALRGHRWN